MAARRRRFTPYRPPLPPAGTYDPSLDAQEAAARRGFIDLRGDVETQGLRAQNDYGLTVDQAAQQGQDLWRGHRYQMEDLGSQFNRGSEDLAQRERRGGEDYTRNIAQLGRNYERLGRQQLQQTNVAGVIRGGALLQSAAKRAENQAWERAPIDTAHGREQIDLANARSRMREDYDRGVSRSTEGYLGDYGQLQRGVGMAGLQYQRQAEDLNTQMTRGGRELNAFSLDTAAQRAYQAAGTGWDPGQGPTNEFTRNGQTYQVRREGNQNVAYRPNGTVLWRRRRA